MTVDPRIRWFAAGVGFGLLFVAVLFAAIACHSMGLAPPTFQPIQPGTTMINLACAVVVIEVRANTDMTFLWWRISIVPKTVPIPSKPEKKHPIT